METQQGAGPGNFDDINILQGLMAGPQLLKRQFSFSRGFQRKAKAPGTGTDGSDFIHGKEWNRTVIQSSNTWTSSSGGDALSDHGDVGDRTEFVLEYNRLASKVSSTFSPRPYDGCLLHQHGIKPLSPDDYDMESVS